MPRFFLRFPSENLRGKLTPTLNLHSGQTYFSRVEPELLIADVSDKDLHHLEKEGVEIIPSRQYQPLSYGTLEQIYQPVTAHTKNLNDVLGHIEAPQAWPASRGDGVHIAIVDTGVCQNMAEFPTWKRSPYGWSHAGSPWTDLQGHGSMTACVAAATSQAGGLYNGVAPNASLISCKTTFNDTELYEIYDYLFQRVEQGDIKSLVINNSYGAYQCSPTGLNVSDPFPKIVRDIVALGVVVVFAAGNNHVMVCKNKPLDCKTNSIWGVNSFDEVICVGTVDDMNRMDQPPGQPQGYCHRDSSRGPGEFAVSTVKPDCVAPTYGEVMWGCGYAAMEWWGTSGAAPQVAGLAALMLARYPALTPQQVHATITSTCKALPLAKTCAGAGLIDCRAAMVEVEALIP